MQRNKGSIQQIVANLLLRLQLSLRLSWSAGESCTSFIQLWIFCTYVLFHDETARICTCHLFLHRSLGTNAPWGGDHANPAAEVVVSVSTAAFATVAVGSLVVLDVGIVSYLGDVSFLFVPDVDLVR